MPVAKKSILIIIRHSPYGSSLARTAIDIALAAGAFEQTVALLFMGDGVLQLIPEQDGAALGTKTISRQIASLPLYDVGRVYAELESSRNYAIDLDSAPVAVIPMGRTDIHGLMCEFDHIMSL